MLTKCNISGIESMLIGNQLRWAGHVARMNDLRLPKRIFYGQLQSGIRSVGAPLKRYKDQVKSNMVKGGLDSKQFNSLAADRSEWRHQCFTSCTNFEQARLMQLEQKRDRRKAIVQHPPVVAHRCPTCGRECNSRIGLFSHQRTHKR